ncbi:hypothetical protein HKO22_00525 [Peptoniphilus sp. AGMB00490]|uniref:Uncharacterized protein n=1 Tax=Peptoniphilus faecalis TaxID=2731255 RepID=A0A848RBM3_9FIRM|nr:hypothetical protein [Peptoniphilus faecalis]NMW84230.1 hypothetical protein [Peptoniphilus faecalis]
MKNKINDINQVFKGKKLLAYDETTGEFAVVSPHIFTSTVYTEEGVPLDEYLTFKPQELIDKLDDILKDAPKEYDTFREIAAELNTNKDSIVEILRAISNRVKMPEGGKAGQVLKLNSDGQVVFDDDKDTVYTHPEIHKAGVIETDPSHRFVTDKEKEIWNNKLDKDSNLEANSITLNNQKKLLKDILNQLIKNTDDLEGLIGVANGLASLDGNKKIPIDQLPEEALKDTTYDLTSYAKSEDLESTYAKISALTNLKKAIDGELEKYVGSKEFDDFVDVYIMELDKKESTIHKGEVNGYAALDGSGKVPEEQLPEKAIREYDLTPYAKSEDIKKTYATKEEVTSGQLDYTAENAANKGKANGYASLGGDGKVPAEQLPSYVDDVLEFASKANFPSSGEKGKIYVDLSTENIYRWSGSAYVEISPSLITQAEIKKLQGIEDGAEKNNVTRAMIDSWNNKITSRDVANVKLTPGTGGEKWSTLSSRELKWWISDLIQRTIELRESLDKKPDVVEMSLEDYNNLTTKNPNTIYATY